MQQRTCGPTEDLTVGDGGIVLQTPKGDVTITAADIGGDQVDFHLDGPPEALALVGQSGGSPALQAARTGKEAA